MTDDVKSRAKRYEVGRLNIIYDTGEAFWSAPVIDVSESGLFVETTHELPEGTTVTIMPDTPDDEELPFEINAVVVRVNEYDLEAHWDRTPGIAFRFEQMPPEHFELLRDFLTAHGVEVRVTK